MSDTHGRESIVLIEIDQPFCTREWGDAFGSPTGLCTAAFTSAFPRKCHQSRVTCPVPEVYNPGTLTLRFTRDQDDLTAFDPVVAGSIVEVTTSPAWVNLGGMESGRTALGGREQVTITLVDHQHPDVQVDKYRLQRFTGEASGVSPNDAYDPNARGTFWGKWLARNPYYQHYPLRVYEGYVGQTLSEMRVRHYLIDSIDGPNDGKVKITAKDIFVVLEAQKAVAPRASRGRLLDAIPEGSPSPTSFTVTPSDIVEADYPHETGSPSELYVAIGDEIIKCSRSGAVFTILLRGCFGTTEQGHDDDDKVQLVLRYTSRLAKDIVYDLLCNYTALGSTGSPSGESPYINPADWTSAAETLDTLYTAQIAQPVPVAQLVGELMEQDGFTVVPNVTTRMVDFVALRAAPSPITATDDGFIVDGSLSVQHKTEWRASQVWVHYGKRNPLKGHEEASNYHSVLIAGNTDKEDDTQYGTAAIRQVFSRWIPQFGRNQAEATGERLLAMFEDPPHEATFSGHATSSAADVELAGLVDLEVAEVQDASGAVDTVQHAVTRIRRGENEISFTSQSVIFADVAAGAERVIYLENDAFNLNLRSVHDSLYTAPVGGSPTQAIRFIVEEGVVIGSTSVGGVALTSGTWPAGVQLTLEVRGRIQGKGGAGGNGASLGVGNATDGQDGGPALEVTNALTVDNTNGEIWGGGGGGGGGGGTSPVGGGYGGSGGGGGAGTNAGYGGVGGIGSAVNGEDGDPGTSEAGGAGRNVAGHGQGGNGGGPGLDGTAGTAESNPGGGAGTKGNYIVGNSFVTWTAVGDVRGGVA